MSLLISAVKLICFFSSEFFPLLGKHILLERALHISCREEVGDDYLSSIPPLRFSHSHWSASLPNQGREMATPRLEVTSILKTIY